jgi:hypothetical protein
MCITAPGGYEFVKQRTMSDSECKWRKIQVQKAITSNGYEDIEVWLRWMMIPIRMPNHPRIAARPDYWRSVRLLDIETRRVENLYADRTKLNEDPVVKNFDHFVLMTVFTFDFKKLGNTTATLTNHYPIKSMFPIRYSSENTTFGGIGDNDGHDVPTLTSLILTYYFVEVNKQCPALASPKIEREIKSIPKVMLSHMFSTRHVIELIHDEEGHSTKRYCDREIRIIKGEEEPEQTWTHCRIALMMKYKGKKYYRWTSNFG